MKLIGLTGGIGSGKSFVASLFKGMGIPVYDSDVAAKFLMNNDPELKESIIDLLGEEAYRESGLDRSFVADKVFGNEALLYKLNAVVHPAVKKHFFRWVEDQDAPYVIQETALIFENQLQNRYDGVILVTAPEEVRIERVMNRDRQTREDVLERMNHQMKDEKKVQLSDFTIVNIHRVTTEKQVRKIHQALISEPVTD